jgi:predicted PhzF superfamily epimerase YddE/YHI9
MLMFSQEIFRVVLNITPGVYRKSFEKVMMHQAKPVLKDIYLDIFEIADSLKITPEFINSSLPKQIVSTGLFTLPICIKSFDILKNIKPDFEKIK